MHVTPIKTQPVLPGKDTDIFKIIDTYIPEIRERSVLAVTSKIVAICEGRVVDETTAEKDALIISEAEQYLPREANKYQVMLTIKNNILAAAAGIDESNGNGYFVLWPKDPQKSANGIRAYIAKSKGLREVGVVITDSTTTPLRWGVRGTAISHSGFQALNNYIGKPDIFGRTMEITKVNVMDALAASAVFVMGEGSEQQPLALLTDLPEVTFQDRNPTQEELDFLHISVDDDLYGSFLKSVRWKKGGQ